MEDILLDFQEDQEVPTNTNSGGTGFATELYKKWFKAGGQSGFLSITPWLTAGKMTVDVGKIDPNTNSVVSNTKCYINAVNLAVYLNSLVAGTGETLFPQRKDCPSPESFVVYGGSGKTNPAVSRIFKIHWWGAKSENPGNNTGFAWKCGHFEGKVSDTGAVMPVLDKPLSTDMIKVSRLEMHEISYRINLTMSGYAAKFNNWYEV